MKLTDATRIERVVWLLWAALLALAAFLVLKVKPDETARLPVQLSQLVPNSFGDWHGQSANLLPIVNPQLRESLKNDYDDLLTRTYLNVQTGRAIMLSISHGSDQGHHSQTHKPEVCYPVQGFAIDSMKRESITAQGVVLPVTTLHAQRGRRSEYITYWMTSGDHVVRGAWEQNIRRMFNVFRGKVAGGLLVRISEVTDDGLSTYEVQKSFIRDLVEALPKAERRLFGVIDP